MNKIKIPVSSKKFCVTPHSASEHSIILVDLPSLSESSLLTDLAALLSIPADDFS